MQDFGDKVVLITGASSGIGAATAINLAGLSAKLALVGRNERNLKKIAMYCEKSKNIKPLTIVADVTQDFDVERIINEVINFYDKLDVLINAAGVYKVSGIKNSTMETYDTVMSTNIRGVYQLTMVAVPYLIKTKGCIVNISCVNSTKPSTMSLAYNISKAALDHFTKCVALELAPDGVRVNSVCPGYVRTNLYKNIGLTEEQLEHYTSNIVNNMPLKKANEPNEVAALIVYLASDKSLGVTGSNFVTDGGMSLR